MSKGMAKSPHLQILTDLACADPSRQARTGIPEVIFAARKSIPICLSIAERMLAEEGRVILSHVSAELLVALEARFNDLVEASPSGQTVVLRGKGGAISETGGRVGLLTAGTSDLPCAEEALIICQELGCRVQAAYDVGVAGLSRLAKPLELMLTPPAVDVIIVVAGMDGALASVVTGLVPLPVIGLPTSVGYGLGGKGEAALLSMLQSCTPGLAVVNIDNGIGAGALACRIANLAAEARQKGG